MLHFEKIEFFFFFFLTKGNLFLYDKYICECRLE